MRSGPTLLICSLLAGCALSGRLGASDQRAWAPSSGATAPTAPANRPAESGSQPAADEATPTAPAVGSQVGPTPTGSPGELVFTRYPGLLLDGELPLVVYLPPGYEWTAGRFPAIYLLHGIGYDEQQWVELVPPARVNGKIASGAWEPLLLIMPLIPDPLLSSTDGGPDSYEVEFLDRLVPYVERNFRADPRRSALAGISRGGVWALEVALRHPDSFTGVAALSPALHMNFPRPQYDPSAIVSQAVQFPAVIYLDAGDREPRTRTAVQEFSGLLNELGVEHTLHLGQGGHDQVYWSSVALGALEALVQGFRDR